MPDARDKAILFRSVQAIVKAKKCPACQANITAYTVACLSWKTSGRLDFERIWNEQSVSSEMRAMIDRWVSQIDQELRKSAGARMPSEWAKKEQCWEVMRELNLELPDPLPHEMQAQPVGAQSEGQRPAARAIVLSRDDLELIDRCRRIGPETWFKVAQWGTKSKAIHWKVAGIARTVGEYAVGGWERSPSAKQAKWAMEAYKAAQEAGAISSEQKL